MSRHWLTSREADDYFEALEERRDGYGEAEPDTVDDEADDTEQLTLPLTFDWPVDDLDDLPF